MTERLDNGLSAVIRVGHSCLDDVLTLREAASFFKRHPKTMLYHVKKGNFDYRPTSGGDYLISRASAEEYFRGRVK